MIQTSIYLAQSMILHFHAASTQNVHFKRT